MRHRCTTQTSDAASSVRSRVEIVQQWKCICRSRKHARKDMNSWIFMVSTFASSVVKVLRRWIRPRSLNTSSWSTRRRKSLCGATGRINWRGYWAESSCKKCCDHRQLTMSCALMWRRGMGGGRRRWWCWIRCCRMCSWIWSWGGWFRLWWSQVMATSLMPIIRLRISRSGNIE